MSLRFWGVAVWLFAFQLFAATSGGLLAYNPWLDVGTAVVMFTVAAFMLGWSLPLRGEFPLIMVMLLIAVASTLLAFRIYGQVSYRWYDLFMLMASPQVFLMSIGFWLGNRQDLAGLEAEF